MKGFLNAPNVRVSFSNSTLLTLLILTLKTSVVSCRRSPWYNRTGWPGVKHQLTYSCRRPTTTAKLITVQFNMLVTFFHGVTSTTMLSPVVTGHSDWLGQTLLCIHDNQSVVREKAGCVLKQLANQSRPLQKDSALHVHWRGAVPGKPLPSISQHFPVHNKWVQCFAVTQQSNGLLRWYFKITHTHPHPHLPPHRQYTRNDLPGSSDY